MTLNMKATSSNHSLLVQKIYIFASLQKIHHLIQKITLFLRTDLSVTLNEIKVKWQRAHFIDSKSTCDLENWVKVTKPL